MWKKALYIITATSHSYSGGSFDEFPISAKHKDKKYHWGYVAFVMQGKQSTSDYLNLLMAGTMALANLKVKGILIKADRKRQLLSDELLSIFRQKQPKTRCYIF